MNPSEKSFDKHLEKKLSYRFKDTTLLRLALTHKSFANESKQDMPNNEKLEFLGDAVLDLILGQYLLQKFPEDQEGGLSKKRASLVNEETLAQLAVSLDIPKFLLLGRGEVQQGGAMKPRLLSSSFEAIVGAIFSDSNFETARQVVQNLFQPLVAGMNLQEDYELDFKTRLQEIVQSRFQRTPQYLILEEKGPAHNRIFRVQVKIEEALIFEGEGKTKKSSEQNAAEVALKFLLRQIEDYELEKKTMKKAEEPRKG